MTGRVRVSKRLDLLKRCYVSWGKFMFMGAGKNVRLVPGVRHKGWVFARCVVHHRNKCRAIRLDDYISRVVALAETFCKIQCGFLRPVNGINDAVY